MKRYITVKTFTIAAVALLALGILPSAKANENRGCNNRSLRGAFSHTASGFDIAPPAPAAPIAGVGTDTFDGNGGVTSSATISVNGNIIPLTATGTYNVNPDCTGTYVIPGTRLVFVITDSGNEIQAICVDPGVVLSHTFKRQFPAENWRQ
jgi:hypothetical protein